MALTSSEKIEHAQLLEEIVYRESREQWKRWFPDDGPYRRDLYKKHMEFFRDTNAHDDDIVECAFIAANRIGKCCTYSTIIETTKGNRMIGDLFGSECDVLTYPNRQSRKVNKWVKKPAEECFRITLDDGRWVEVPGGHQILAHGQYISVERLLQLLPESLVSRPRSSSALSRLVHALDVRRWIQKAQDYLDDCVVLHRLCDAQLLTAKDSVEVYLPLLADAQLHTGHVSRLGAMAHRCIDNLYGWLFHLSMKGAYRRSLGLFSSFLVRASCSAYQWLFYRNRSEQQYHSESHHQHEADAIYFHQDQVSSYQSIGIDGNKIVSIKSVGYKTLYDMEVDERHNYIAGGLVHHNTIVGAYCAKVWSTGIYPDWWMGKYWPHATNGWCAGDTGETVRDIIQLELLGPPGNYGTGMLPAESIVRKTSKGGNVADAIKDIYVEHAPTGDSSYIGLKSYDQKRKSFQGTAKHWIWNDEEPPMDVYSEEIIRLMTTKGVLINTFTPLSGLSDVVLSFLPGGKSPKV